MFQDRLQPDLELMLMHVLWLAGGFGLGECEIMVYNSLATDGTIALPVQDLVRAYTTRWLESARSLPQLGQIYPHHMQSANARRLSRFLSQVSAEVDRSSRMLPLPSPLYDRLILSISELIGRTLGADERALAPLRAPGFSAATAAFAQLARRFDPALTSDDLYQASRNIWTANLLQLLLGLPVEVTPALFAYSMLYPYTDNYLDDPAVGKAEKVMFNQRFRRLLAGEPQAPQNRHEQAIAELVGMIELQYERARYPQVFASLLAIHGAQEKSLRQQQHAPAPHEVLATSIEKGGTSVLADGYLVAGDLSAAQRASIFGFGVVTQLLDDLEDLEQNRSEKVTTIFTQGAQHEPLDGLTSRTFRFCAEVLGHLDGLGAAELAPFNDLVRRGTFMALIDSVGRASQHYTTGYLQALEQFSPFRFADLRKCRARMERRQVSLASVLDMFTASSAVGVAAAT